MIKVDGFVLGPSCLVDQLISQSVAEIEMLLDHGVKFVTFASRHFAVDGGGVHEQCRRSEPVIVIGELAWMFVALNKFGDEIPQRFEHELSVIKGSTIPTFICEVKRAIQGRL